MMRGLRPLVGVVVAGWAASAAATEMVEVPTPPEYRQPPAECCVAVEPARSREPGELLFSVSAGPTYRRAFREDFVAAAVELEVGGQTPSWGIGARMRADLGATRVGLPYQFVAFGPHFFGHLTQRLRLGVSLRFGQFSYERVSAAHDPTVWALAIGADVDASLDLVRSRRGGALYVDARVGYDWIDNFGGADALSTGSSFAFTAALGYRY